jgi:hypothetical protein
VILVHIGVMLLLVGAMFTALSGREGFIELEPGKSREYVTDYHKRELVMLDAQGSVLQSWNFATLRTGQDLAAGPFVLHIDNTCRNCKITRRADADDSYQGMSKFMQLSNDKPRANDEENLGGITFTVPQTGQTWLTLDGVPKLPEMTAPDGKIYRFSLRRQQRLLPFSIDLITFKRETYPGTNTPKSFSSRVRITDGKTRWESLISMNEPLRYKGYTFYQASFVPSPQGDVSILAAVHNAGRTFPYLSGITVCLGLILHLLVRKGRRTRHV